MSKTWRRVNKDDLRAYGPRAPRKKVREPRVGGSKVSPTTVKNLKIEELDEGDFDDLYADWDRDE